MIILNTKNQNDLGAFARHRCCDCGIVKPDNEFHKSNSRLFSGLGHVPICRDCLEQEYRKYRLMYNDDQKAMRRICMLIDVYYSEKIFQSCNHDGDGVVSGYIAKTRIGRNRGRTFDTSIEEGLITLDASDTNTKEEVQEETISPRLISKWGVGLLKDEYDELEKHYKYLKDSNPNCDSNQEIFITELCYTKMQQMKAIREGNVDDYKKLSDTYRNTFSQAKLQTGKDQSASDSFTLGVTIETIEKYTPAEYYKDKTLYKDMDGIGDYAKRFILRPLRNLMHGTHDRDEEYHVIDGGDTNAVTK